MDVKVDVSNVLLGDHHATDNAGIWLREHLSVPRHLSIIKEYEQYFNCRIDTDDRTDAWLMPNKVVFETGADLTAFLLRWS
jgi:hypothetical protein